MATLNFYFVPGGGLLYVLIVPDIGFMSSKKPCPKGWFVPDWWSYKSEFTKQLVFNSNQYVWQFGLPTVDYQTVHTTGTTNEIVTLSSSL